MKDMDLVQILWDYMRLNQTLEKVDCIIGLGTIDLNVVDVVADCYNKRFADDIIFSGGLGKVTKAIWERSEAELFAEKAIGLGVPKERIRVENQSTNTGDNLRFTKKLIETEKLPIHSCIIVCKPFSERRTYACWKKTMPEWKGIITSQNIKCEDYFNQYGNGLIEKEEGIHVLVGEIQRLKLFAKKGWQMEVDIPKTVWKTYEELIKRGYDKYVITE